MGDGFDAPLNGGDGASHEEPGSDGSQDVVDIVAPHQGGVNRKLSFGALNQKRDSLPIHMNLCSPDIRRRINAIGHDLTGGLRMHSFEIRVIRIEKGFSFPLVFFLGTRGILEKPHLGLKVRLKVLVEIQMILCKIGKYSNLKITSPDPILGQGMGGNLHDCSLHAMGHHF